MPVPLAMEVEIAEPFFYEIQREPETGASSIGVILYILVVSGITLYFMIRPKKE
jgi:hypothetical protein